MVYRTLKENLSFDELFTSQVIADPVYSDLTASNMAYKLMSIDTKNMKNGAGQISPYEIRLENGQIVQATQFDLKNHANISGLFSSLTFLTRYWNGERNENRKRAAAYFRIMLCDSMSPALERESEKEKERRFAMGKTDEEVIINELKAAHGANKHGTQKDCAACHSRLEPVGITMFAMEQGISNESFEATALFPNATNEQVGVKVNNFHDLIVKTTQQPRYVDCQTNWLIEAFLGKDVTISSPRMTEIINLVENKKRRLKSVIEELLMTPEIRGFTTQKTEPPSLIAAKAVLSNCTECHSNTFKLRPEQMKARLSRIAVCLDLPNGGKDPQMPPSDHYWQPTTTEIGAVKDWLNQGAPLDETIKLFQKNEVDQLFSQGKEVKKCRQ